MDPIWPLPGNSLRPPQAPPARRAGGTEGKGTGGAGRAGGQPSAGGEVPPPAALNAAPSAAEGSGTGEQRLGCPGGCPPPLPGVSCRLGASTSHGWRWQEKGAVSAVQHCPLHGAAASPSAAAERPGASSAGVTQTHLPISGRSPAFSVLEGHHIPQGSGASAPRCFMEDTREPHQSGSHSVGLSRATRAHGH